VIVNGSSNRCASWWGKHLQSEENDNVRVVKSFGLRSDTIEAMLEEMMERARGTKCENPFYQMNINPAPGERLTEEGWDRAREIAEKKHGFEGQPYFMVMHVKYGREHPHFIYSRIDIENMRAISDSLDAKKNHAIAREIERELGLQKTIGPYDREAGAPRPPRAPKKYEMYRDKQNGLDTRDIKAEVSELFQQSHNGKEFRATLEEHGYRLATGRRGLLILDSAGKEHSLARRCGVPMKEVVSFMRDVDMKTVPIVEQAREQFQERKIAGLEADRATVRDEIQWQEALDKAAIAKEKTERQFVEPEERAKEEARAGREQAGSRKERIWPVNPPQHQSWPGFEKAATDATRDDRTENLKGPAAKVWEAFCQSDSAQAFASALDDKGIMFAVVSSEEAARSHREAAFAREIGNRAPRLREGEIVIVTEPRLEYRRNGEIIEPIRIHRIDQSLAYKFTKGLDNRDALQGIDATLKASNGRAQKRTDEWQKIRLENATNLKKPISVKKVRKQVSRAAGSIIKHTIPEAAAAIGKVAGAVGSLGKALDVIGGMVESLAAPAMSPAQIHEGEKAKDRREAEADYTIDFSRVTAEAAQQRQEQDREASRQRERDGGGRER